MIEESENIVKKTCRELGITQKELAEMIGVKPESLNSSISRGKISNHTLRSIEMFVEIYKLKEQLQDCQKTESVLKNLFSNELRR